MDRGAVYNEFGKYAKHSYNGICFSFFLPDVYSPGGISGAEPYVVYNFDKINEPKIWVEDGKEKKAVREFEYGGDRFKMSYPKFLTSVSSKTDRFTDALIYAMSILPAAKRSEMVGKYKVIRTDHRFHPHFRRKIYRQKNSYVADLPYGYINLYANSKLTLSDRVHACAATLAFGNSAMLFSKTNRSGLLERVGASDICSGPVKLDLDLLAREKNNELEWLRKITLEESGS